ncbi:MAG: ABC transporter permease, partial [Gracilibacteraceae bacterium]|nr:ABC transporter permease [Gracilibacteraceae bacterium]
MVKLLLVKMLRDMNRSKAVYIICVLVAVIGFSGYSLMSIAYGRLMTTRDAFFAATDFSEVFAAVRQAPLGLAAKLAAVPGVSQVEGRLTETARVSSLGEEKTPDGAAELLLISIRPDGLNRPYLSAGSLPAAGRAQMVLGEGFAEAHGLKVGDSVSLIADGRSMAFEICGLGISPENIYLLKNLADLLPDLSAYDGAFLDYGTLAAFLSKEGAANNFAFTLQPGVAPGDVKAAIENILDPYVCQRVYDRTEHVSTSMLQAELDQLKRMAGVIPFLFLLVAAVILYISLFRLVEQQRSQIGTMLALGFSHRAAGLHYASFGACAGFAGGVGGGLIGIASAVPIWEYYLTFFRMPRLGEGFAADYPYLFSSAAAGTVFCALIGWLAARGLTRLQPADALRPAAPSNGRAAPLEKLPFVRAILTLPG